MNPQNLYLYSIEKERNMVFNTSDKAKPDSFLEVIGGSDTE